MLPRETATRLPARTRLPATRRLTLSVAPSAWLTRAPPHHSPWGCRGPVGSRHRRGWLTRMRRRRRSSRASPPPPRPHPHPRPPPLPHQRALTRQPRASPRRHWTALPRQPTPWWRPWQSQRTRRRLSRSRWTLQVPYWRGERAVPPSIIPPEAVHAAPPEAANAEQSRARPPRRLVPWRTRSPNSTATSMPRAR